MLDAKNVNYYFNSHFPKYGSRSNINNVFSNVLQEETMHLLHITLILNSCQHSFKCKLKSKESGQGNYLSTKQG